MGQTGQQVLTEAIERKAAIVFSMPSTGGVLRHCRSRFLAQTVDGIWIESNAEERILVQSCAESTQPIGVVFKNSTKKVVFSSTIVRLEPEYAMPDGTKVEALLLQHPPKIEVIERRSAFRVTVPAASALNVKIWRIGKDTYVGDRPLAAQRVPFQMRELSTGGMGILLPVNDSKFLMLKIEERLRIELCWQDECTLIEGQVRYIAPAEGVEQVRAGIQFKGLDRSVKGRQIVSRLNRIVSEFQRHWLTARNTPTAA